jgi:hypothetical protein
LVLPFRRRWPRKFCKCFVGTRSLQRLSIHAKIEMMPKFVSVSSTPTTITTTTTTTTTITTTTTTTTTKTPSPSPSPTPEASGTRGQCYKTFYGRNLRLFIIS